mmetsp:Transcript_9621/g.13067  ORF Transcript_9621/g.13067 Transcript_9621/m.13067 type:complete len:453 (+) Transcript_9621:142-1500(+)|eukprot:CAMPEP_0196586460 /NCGR_PEP_ID=MMETSP1081-20130531/54367_1 /TAXON_ID=36882 /ORGANISM="Pyramimonas amylifera, Strain CCMP720" /LENGTH=452 /DNA_ID=CAMNT_0041908355 /DNA_START=140 /DNA_END=1498 /DNA_ORIENTATION=+
MSDVETTGSPQYDEEVDDDALVDEEEPDSEHEEQQHRKELAKKIFGDSEDEEEVTAGGESDDDQQIAKGSKKRSREDKDKHTKKRNKKDKDEKEKKRDKLSKKNPKGDGRDKADDTDRMFARLGESSGFIDDDGVAEEDRDDRDSDADSIDAPEAVEDNDDFDKLFEFKSGGKRGRKVAVCAAEARQHVELFLSKMELAVDQDQEANQRGRPAIHKLQMLKEVQEVVEKTYLHEDLLEAGLLNVMRAWLEPLKDGSIPNVNVRTTLLKLLKKLPVNVEMFDRRDQLKKSGLGKMVMFLYKLPEESMQNKKIAQSLVEQWSRPIFELSTRYEDLRRGEDDAHIPQSREKLKEKAGAIGEGDLVRDAIDPLELRPGDPGYRYRASVPQRTTMDYLHRPESRVKVDGPIKARNTAGNDGSRSFRIQKKMVSIAQNAKKKDVHAMKVSIEGRGLAF